MAESDTDLSDSEAPPKVDAADDSGRPATTVNPDLSSETDSSDDDEALIAEIDRVLDDEPKKPLVEPTPSPDMTSYGGGILLDTSVLVKDIKNLLTLTANDLEGGESCALGISLVTPAHSFDVAAWTLAYEFVDQVLKSYPGTNYDLKQIHMNTQSHMDLVRRYQDAIRVKLDIEDSLQKFNEISAKARSFTRGGQVERDLYDLLARYKVNLEEIRSLAPKIRESCSKFNTLGMISEFEQDVLGHVTNVIPLRVWGAIVDRTDPERYVGVARDNFYVPIGYIEAVLDASNKGRVNFFTEPGWMSKEAMLEKMESLVNWRKVKARTDILEGYINEHQTRAVAAAPAAPRIAARAPPAPPVRRSSAGSIIASLKKILGRGTSATFYEAHTIPRRRVTGRSAVRR